MSRWTGLVLLAFRLPGQYGMDKFEQDELPKPTRWTFSDG
jgi:hypothetical protein